MSNQIEKISDVPTRWYVVVIRGGQSLEVNETTAEEIIKADKIVVLRDDQGRLVRYINKADVSDIYWDKTITREKYLKEKT